MDESQISQIQQKLIGACADYAMPLKTVENLKEIFLAFFEAGGGNADEFKKIPMTRNSLKAMMKKQKETNLSEFKKVSSSLASTGLFELFIS